MVLHRGHHLHEKKKQKIFYILRKIKRFLFFAGLKKEIDNYQGLFEPLEALLYNVFILTIFTPELNTIKRLG